MSSRSKTVSRSSGGNASQSSWYELLPENDGFRDNRGLPGLEAEKIGVLSPSGGDELVEDAPEMPLRRISGDKFPLSIACSSFAFAPGIGIGSDISRIVRLCAVDDVTPKETLRSKLPPRSTRPSAIVTQVDEAREMRLQYTRGRNTNRGG